MLPRHPAAIPREGPTSKSRTIATGVAGGTRRPIAEAEPSPEAMWLAMFLHSLGERGEDVEGHQYDENGNSLGEGAHRSGSTLFDGRDLGKEINVTPLRKGNKADDPCTPEVSAAA